MADPGTPPPPTPPHFGNGVGQSCRSCVRVLQAGPTERGRRCCAVGLLLDTPRTTDKRHSVRCSPPQSTPTDRAAPPPVRCLQTEGKRFGVTVIFTLILFTEGKQTNKTNKQKHRLRLFLPSPMKSFSFASLRPATGGTPDTFPWFTVHESRFLVIQCFFLLFADLLDCG